MFGFGVNHARRRAITREISDIEKDLDRIPQRKPTSVFHDIDAGRFKRRTVSTAKAEYLGKMDAAREKYNIQQQKKQARTEAKEKVKSVISHIGKGLKKIRQESKKIKAASIYSPQRRQTFEGRNISLGSGPAFGDVSNSPFAIHNPSLKKKL